MTLWTPEEFTARLREVGAVQYHDKHPFHKLMNDGKLTREQLRVWIANRFYYQKIIPVKDAIMLSRIPDRAIRQLWIQRIIDHDGLPPKEGEVPPPGGIEKWLRLGEAAGLTREELDDERHLLPAVRYAVDAYVQLVSTRSWVEGVASSLTELFAPKLMATRLAAFEKHYTWIAPWGLDYFRGRLTQAPRDSDHGLAVVIEHCRTPEAQQRAVAALRTKCELLWAQLDAMYLHCVLPAPKIEK